jgi:hypothetical protein
MDDEERRVAAERRRRRGDLLGGLFGAVVALPIGCSVIAGFSLVAWQCVQWLNFATWPPSKTLHDVVGQFGYFETGWLGLDGVLNWFLDQPLPISLILYLPLIWLLLGWLVFSLIFKLLGIDR